MILKLRRIFFYLLIFTLPFQVGYHFWPDFAFIKGIRVDYLSPTLYPTDIFILIIFLLSFFDPLFKTFFKRLTKINLFCILLSVYLAIVTYAIALTTGAYILGLVRLFEVLFVASYVSLFVKKKDISYLSDALATGMIVVSIIGISQFILQHSIGSICYFLGERSFNMHTPGIALFFMHGQDILRPYSTFPHPNVFAFYLLLSLVFSWVKVRSSKRLEKAFFYLSISLGSIALFLTFSRIVILFYVLFLLWYSVRIVKKKIATYGLIALFISFFIFFASRFTLNSFIKDLVLRQDLINISYNIFLKHMLIGVGLNNFFIHEIEYQKILTPTLLQPVHNIYMYLLVETGIIGLLIFLKVLFSAFKSALINVFRKGEQALFSKSTLFLLSSFLVVGLFDHYFITLEQGRIMMAIIIGLSLNKFKGKSIDK